MATGEEARDITVTYTALRNPALDEWLEQAAVAGSA